MLIVNVGTVIVVTAVLVPEGSPDRRQAVVQGLRENVSGLGAVASLQSFGRPADEMAEDSKGFVHLVSGNNRLLPLGKL
jgi:hypothetical protein